MNTVQLIHSQMEQFIQVWNMVEETDRWYLLYTKHTEYTELYELVGYDTASLGTAQDWLEQEVNDVLQDVYDKCIASVATYKDLCDVEGGDE